MIPPLNINANNTNKLADTAAESTAPPIIIESKGKFPLFEKLLSFVDVKTEVELNPVLAGYVVKLFGCLLEKRRLDIWRYFHTYSEHIKNLISHCDNQSIAEMIVKLLENGETPPADPLIKEQKRELVKELVQSRNKRTFEGRWETIYSVITAKLDLDYFLSAEIVHSIYETAYSDSDCRSVGLKVLRALLECNVIPLKPPMRPGLYDPGMMMMTF